MPITFEDIRAYLMSVLPPAVGDGFRDGVERWIRVLSPDDDSDLLGTCIAIDLKSEALAVERFARVLERMPAGSSPRSAFAEALELLSESLKMCSCFPKTADHGAGAYANVIDLGTFLEHYANPSGYPMTLDDLAEVDEVFFGSRPRVTLDEIKRPWAGPRGIVWVLPLTELEAIIDGKSPEMAATLLHDALGLWVAWKGPMVYLKYPVEAPLDRYPQPTTFDAGFYQAGGCFLSAAEGDGWGRTQSRSGTPAARRERVHGPIERLSKAYTLTRLGTPSRKPRNEAAIRAEGLERFQRLNAKELVG